MDKEKKSSKGFALGLLTGAVTGALFALLYTPKSGKELRKDIGKKKDELIDEAEKYIDKAKSKASGIIDGGKKKAEELFLEAKHKSENITRGAERIYAQSKERVTKEAFKIKDAVKSRMGSNKED